MDGVNGGKGLKGIGMTEAMRVTVIHELNMNCTFLMLAHSGSPGFKAVK